MGTSHLSGSSTGVSIPTPIREGGEAREGGGNKEGSINGYRHISDKARIFLVNNKV